MFKGLFAMGAALLVGGLLFGATAFAQGPHGPGGAYRGEQSLIAVAAEELGLTRDQLVGELEAGKTIAQVAEEKGVAPETITDAFVAIRKEFLDVRVAEGRLTAEQAAEQLAVVEAQIAEHLTQPWPFEGGRGDGVCTGEGANYQQHLYGPMGRFGARGR